MGPYANLMQELLHHHQLQSTQCMAPRTQLFSFEPNCCITIQLQFPLRLNYKNTLSACIIPGREILYATLKNGIALASYSTCPTKTQVTVPEITPALGYRML